MMRIGLFKKTLTANRSEVQPKPTRGAEGRYAAVICALLHRRGLGLATCNTLPCFSFEAAVRRRKDSSFMLRPSSSGKISLSMPASAWPCKDEMALQI